MTDPEVPAAIPLENIEPAVLQQGPADEATLLERLRNIDYSDHTGAMIAAGAAIGGLVALGYAIKKHHGISAGFADRHNEDKGIISILSMDGKLAASLPSGPEVLQKLKDKDIFSMHRKDGERGHRFGYPLLGNAEHIEEHRNVLRKLVNRITNQQA